MPKVYIETYGCQMNVADSEVVAAILLKQDFELSKTPEEADLILVNTCSIRDNAEKKVKNRLGELNKIKQANLNGKLGIIGCMAERLKEELIETIPGVDIIAGPDSYRDLPRLLLMVSRGEKGINTQLSMEETYGEITPVRMDENKVSAFISIMRGCNNFCSYCVVPFTRGRERSRDLTTILNEISQLETEGYKEVTLLGQNVNSWKWQDPKKEKIILFPELLTIAAVNHPHMRIRFATSHPKDLSEEVLHAIKDHPNLCNHIHLPVQSGSDKVLKRMNRKYSSSQYLERIHAIKNILPDASISTDIIAGFSGEEEKDHQQTLALMKEVDFDFAYMFKYSERPGTRAAEKFPDNVPEDVKTRRLNEIIDLQNELSYESKRKDLGKTYQVLIEGESKKSKDQYFGRNSQNKVVVFPKSIYKKGDFARVKIENHTSATLIGKPVQNEFTL